MQKNDTLLGILSWLSVTFHTTKQLKELSLHICSSVITTEFVSTSLKKQGMKKLPEILVKLDPGAFMHLA